MLQGLAERVTNQLLPTFAVTDTENSERQRNDAANRSTANVGKLEAASAQIADDAVSRRDGGHHAFAGEGRFFLGTEHVAFKANAVDCLDEFRAIARVAGGCRGDGPDLFDAHMIDQQPVAA